MKAILGIMDVPRVAIRGGNCNNGGNAGFRYVNVNNAASNSNWNIGASPVSRNNKYSKYRASIIPYPLVKMNFVKAA